MKTRPIIYTAPMVQAILRGQKWKTRRIAKPQPNTTWLGYKCYPDLDGPGTARLIGPDYPDTDEDVIRCPYGEPGDRLWVRESFSLARVTETQGHLEVDDWKGPLPTRKPTEWDLFYRADMHDAMDANGCWRPSIHMPRWASRLTLTVKSVDIEQLQSITDSEIRSTVRSTTSPEGSALARTARHFVRRSAGCGTRSTENARPGS